jgi:hypothetical protein
MLVGKMIAIGVNKNFEIKDKYGGNDYDGFGKIWNI